MQSHETQIEVHMMIVQGNVGSQRPLHGPAQVLLLHDVVVDLRRELAAPATHGSPRHAIRALRKTDEMSVLVMVFEAGAILHDHVAPAPVTVTVLEGSMRFTVGAETIDLREGEAIACDAHVRHAVEALSPLALMLHVGAKLIDRHH